MYNLVLDDGLHSVYFKGKDFNCFINFLSHYGWVVHAHSTLIIMQGIIINYPEIQTAFRRGWGIILLRTGLAIWSSFSAFSANLHSWRLRRAVNFLYFHCCSIDIKRVDWHKWLAINERFYTGNVYFFIRLLPFPIRSLCSHRRDVIYSPLFLFFKLALIFDRDWLWYSSFLKTKTSR